MQRSLAVTAPDAAATTIFPTEPCLLLTESQEDLAREVVSAVLAVGIVAHDEEERGRVLDDDTPDVSCLRARRRGARRLGDLELQRLELRDGRRQARRAVFTLPAFGETFARFGATPSPHVDLLPRALPLLCSIPSRILWKPRGPLG